MTEIDARWLTDTIGQIDTNFTGVPNAIAAYLLPTNDGLAVVDPGPSTVLDTLLAGVRQLGHDPDDLRHILVTHIHLDHAGASGTLLSRSPSARLYVHEVGAPHLFDPTNLLRSATRIYGNEMDRLWGEFLPVPVTRTTILHDGDRLNIGGRTIDVLYTPGHASHHVAFFEAATGTIFAGDVGGIRLPPVNLPIPPTPPPDIDVPAWKRSIERLRALNAQRLLVAHFGEVTRVESHLHELEANLDELVELVEDGIAVGLERDGIVDRFRAWVRVHADAELHPEMEQQFAINVPYGMGTDGLMRFVRKRAESSSRSDSA